MGCVTGKGLAALIRENFGVRISFFAMLVLFFINTLHHGDGVRRHCGGVGDLSDISRYIAVPIALVCRLLLRLALQQQNRRAHLRRVLAHLRHLYRLGACSRIPTGTQVAARDARSHVRSFSNAGWVAMVVGSSARRSHRTCSSSCSRRSSKKARDEEDLTLARIDVINGSILAHRARRLHDHRERRDDLLREPARRATVIRTQAADFARRARAARRASSRRRSLRSAS